jgi:pimeloyl-ACP methyl ester carboxylesterase
MAQPPEGQAPLVRGEVAVRDIDAVSRFVREKRGLPKCVHFGYSWGTALMGRYAADNAAAVERLVLFAPVWNRQGASLADPGGELGAYRYVTQAQARARRGAGVPEAARATLVPAGWFEHWAGVTWATDPEGQRRSPPALRAPNGSVADGREFWGAGRPFYDPAKITAPALLVLGEWDQDTPPYMAQTLFPLLTRAVRPASRLVPARGRHAQHVVGAQPRRAVPGRARSSGRGLRPDARGSGAICLRPRRLSLAASASPSAATGPHCFEVRSLPSWRRASPRRTCCGQRPVAQQPARSWRPGCATCSRSRPARTSMTARWFRRHGIRLASAAGGNCQTQ